MWYVIVRYEKSNPEQEFCEDCGKTHAKAIYPAEGYPILIYADKERAEQVCKGNGNNYQVVPVDRIKND